MKGSCALGVFALLLVASFCGAAAAQGQVATTPVVQTKKPSKQPRTSSATVVAEVAAAPQVVTILHRLSGLKMLGLLVRSDDKLKAIAELDDAFKLMGDVHTNVIAGLAMDDGQTIVVRLPEVEAELGSPLLPFAPKVPLPPGWPSLPTGPAEFPSAPPPALKREFFETPDVTVVAQGGKRFPARYIGLDGVTGLSILKLEGDSVLPAFESKAETISVGQRLRLFAPKPARATITSGSVRVEVGETEGTVTKVTQAPTGSPSRLKIKTAGLSQAIIGGIATNHAGETVGIIDNIEQGEAIVLSANQIRNAARRVLEKQSSVPRPWLGVTGEPISALAPSYLVSNGWHQPDAMALTRERYGILLTSVAPDSPASTAALRPGDVILRMNGEYIRGADDFSWLLEQAGPGASVTFTVRHPGQSTSEAVNLILSGAFVPRISSKMFARSTPQFKKKLFQNHGIETVSLMPAVAESLGASGGLLVFSVQPDSEAFKAGLRPGDVIEAIDGERVSAGATRFAAAKGNGVTFEVVRRKQKLTFTLANAPK
jgi:S1-C subfamily serine protease